MTAQDPELSAALGWPGGISDPVLGRKTLLQMVATMRLASQQALEVLKFCTPKPRPTDDDYAEQGWKEHNAAITALRAALAQQAEPVQEPVAWVASKDGRVIYDDTSKDDGLLRVSGDFEDDEQRVRYAKQIVDKLNAAPAQQAEPVEPVEPVYWEVRCAAHPKWMRVDEKQFDEYVSYGWEGQRLYTAPPQRTMVPLTEEEIDIIGITHQSLRQVVRAVERAHGIKE